MSSSSSNTSEFKIPMSGNQVKKHQVTAMHLIAAILFIVMGFISFVTPFALGMARSADNSPAKAQLHWVNIAGVLLSILGVLILLLVIFFGKRVTRGGFNLFLRIIEIAAFTSILIYSIMNKWYLPAVYSGAGLAGILIAYFLERSGNSQKYTVINEQGVRLQGTGRTVQLQWREIKAIILKHNVLTVDLRNNKLYQLTYLKGDSIVAPEVEKFASGQIVLHEKEHDTDW